MLCDICTDNIEYCGCGLDDDQLYGAMDYPFDRFDDWCYRMYVEGYDGEEEEDDTTTEDNGEDDDISEAQRAFWRQEDEEDDPWDEYANGVADEEGERIDALVDWIEQHYEGAEKY